MFKTRLTDGGVVQSEVVEHTDTRKLVNDETVPVRTVEPVRDQVREMETTTVSLLDELRKKLNLDSTERPSRLVEDEVPSTSRRPSLRVLETIPEKSSRVLETIPEEKKSSRVLETIPEEKKSSRVLETVPEKSLRELETIPEKSSRVLESEEKPTKSERSEKSEKTSKSERSEEDDAPVTTRRPSLRLIEVTTEESLTQEQRDFDVQSSTARLFLKSMEKKFKKPEV